VNFCLKTIFCCCFLVWSTSFCLARDNRIHIVWDLDGTLVDWATDLPNHPESFELMGERYLPSLGAEWVVGEIAAHPLVATTSFYSGGLEERNVQLLKRLWVNHDGSKHSFLELASQVLSRHHFILPGHPDQTVSHISQIITRLAKKDLSRISANLENVILVDDWHDFTPEEQRGNVLALGKSYTPFASFEDAQTWLFENSQLEGALRWVPLSQEEWFRHRYKLIRAYNIIMESLEALSDSSNRKTFRELVYQKTRDPHSNHIKAGLRRISARCEALFQKLSFSEH
jgi:hypothetical protein